jgi:hypothetical protein
MEGFAQLLLEDSGKELTAEAKEHVTYITAAAARMDLLIQDVLDLHHPSAYGDENVRGRFRYSGSAGDPNVPAVCMPGTCRF